MLNSHLLTSFFTIRKQRQLKLIQIEAFFGVLCTYAEVQFTFKNLGFYGNVFQIVLGAAF